MSLALTRLQDFRPDSPDLSQQTARADRYGAYDVAMLGNKENRSILNSRVIQDTLTIIGRDPKIPVLDSKTVTVSTSRSVTVADEDNTSALYTVTMATATCGFTIVETAHGNNNITKQQDFNRKYEDVIYAFGDTFETAAITAMDAAKTQVLADDLGRYTFAANTVDVPLAQRDKCIGDMSVLQRANKFQKGSYYIVGNPGFDSLMTEQLELGKFNERDKTYQHRDKTFHFTNSLSNAANRDGTAYVIPKGSIGMLFRYEPQAALGRTLLPNGTLFDRITLPLLNCPMSLYYYYGVSDEATRLSEPHLQRVVKEHYSFSIDYAVVTAHMNAPGTNAQPIQKWALMDS